VSYFKSFKTTFRKVKDVTTFKSNHMKPYKITLVGWVDQVIDQSLTKKKSRLGSRLQVFGLSTPRQWTTRFEHQKFTMQQTSTTMEVIKRNAHQMKKLIIVNDACPHYSKLIFEL